MIRKGIEPAVKVAYFEYDFAKDGGALGAVTMRGDYIPAGSLVIDGRIFVNTAVTSTGAATVALHLLSAGDIVTATGKASLTLNACLATIPVGTAATSINMTSGAKLIATIAGEVLTAGKITVALMYI